MIHQRSKSVPKPGPRRRLPTTWRSATRSSGKLRQGSSNVPATTKGAGPSPGSTPEIRVLRRGIALTPVKFGISFTLTHYNQAGALAHVYRDGSVHVNHGGTEMGQGLMTKVMQVAASVFGLAPGAAQDLGDRHRQGAEYIRDGGFCRLGSEWNGDLFRLQDDT